MTIPCSSLPYQLYKKNPVHSSQCKRQTSIILSIWANSTVVAMWLYAPVLYFLLFSKCTLIDFRWHTFFWLGLQKRKRKKEVSQFWASEEKWSSYSCEQYHLTASLSLALPQHCSFSGVSKYFCKVQLNKNKSTKTLPMNDGSLLSFEI